MTQPKQPEFTIKAWKKNELARFYGVSTQTLKKWIFPFKNELSAESKKAQYFLPIDVKIIVENLGLPNQTPNQND